MKRMDMPPRTVYKYSANGVTYPILVLEPHREVRPYEVVGTREASGQRLKVNYVRGNRPTTPGLLGIIWKQGTDEQQACELEKLTQLDQNDVLRSDLGHLLLPRDAVAVVVYPRNLEQTWDDWRLRQAELNHPRTAAELATMESQRQEREDAKREKARRETSVVQAVEVALAIKGAVASEILFEEDDYSFDDPALYVNVTIPLRQLMKFLTVDLPDWADAKLMAEADSWDTERARRRANTSKRH